MKKPYLRYLAAGAALALGAFLSLLNVPGRVRSVRSENAREASVSPLSETGRERFYRAEYKTGEPLQTLPIYTAKNIREEVFLSGVKVSSQKITDPVKAAESYYKKEYSDVGVNEFPEYYEVVFSTRVSRFQNMAFPDRAYLDFCGNLIKMELREAEYENAYEIKIISPKEAYNKLPLPSPNQTEDFVTLERCELLYIYEDSLVQPVYCFEGKTQKGELFKTTVKASNF
jgi:hypothetical protein